MKVVLRHFLTRAVPNIHFGVELVGRIVYSDSAEYCQFHIRYSLTFNVMYYSTEILYGV